MGLSPIRRRIQQALPAPLFGPDGPRGPQARNAEAERLAAALTAAQSSRPAEGGIAEVLARIGTGAFTGLQQSRLEQEELDANRAASEAFTAALSGGTGNNDALVQALANPNLSSAQQSILGSVLAGNINRANAGPTPIKTDVLETGDGRKVLYNVQTGETIRVLDEGVPPNPFDSNETRDGRGFNDPPAGFIYNRDDDGFIVTDENGVPSMTAIEGSPQAIAQAQAQAETEAETAEANTKLEAAETRTRDVATRINETIERAFAVIGATRDAEGNLTVDQSLFNPADDPLGRAIGQFLPGTSTKDLAALVDTIKANIGFAELQALRDASPTGGALGQVTERELAFLQSVLGSLDVTQGTPQLLENLQKIQQSYQRILAAITPAAEPPPLNTSPGNQDRNASQAIQNPPAIAPGLLTETGGFSQPAAVPGNTLQPDAVPTAPGQVPIPQLPADARIPPDPNFDPAQQTPLPVGGERVINGVRIRRLQ